MSKWFPPAKPFTLHTQHRVSAHTVDWTTPFCFQMLTNCESASIVDDVVISTKFVSTSQSSTQCSLNSTYVTQRPLITLPNFDMRLDVVLIKPLR